MVIFKLLCVSELIVTYLDLTNLGMAEFSYPKIVTGNGEHVFVTLKPRVRKEQTISEFYDTCLSRR